MRGRVWCSGEVGRGRWRWGFGKKRVSWQRITNEFSSRMGHSGLTANVIISDSAMFRSMLQPGFVTLFVLQACRGKHLSLTPFAPAISQ